MSFREEERSIQLQWAAQAGLSDFLEPEPGWRFDPEYAHLNLAPSLRFRLGDMFDDRDIHWHPHCDSLLSSQTCCLNFLAPLAFRPSLLSRVVGAALRAAPAPVLPMECWPGGYPWHVAFEWPGRADHLGEWPGGHPFRGAVVTCADAALMIAPEGRRETVLIEWKYCESYGGRLPDGPRGRSRKMRAVRYADVIFAPQGPLRPDLGISLDDFLYEPFYQMLRLQLLACRMQRAAEDGAERVTVLHLSPRDNVTLRRMTSPGLRRFGADALAVFRELLADPTTFQSRTIDEVFGPFATAAHDHPKDRAWARYLKDRYVSLLKGSTSAAA